MKNNNIYTILFCMFSMLAISACETEVQKSSSIDDKTITSRTDDCDDCPVADCCCKITYVSGNGASLEICGSTGNRLSTRPCGSVDPPGDDCDDVAATYYLGPFSIDAVSTYQIFCVPENASFMINAIIGSVVANISCQNGQTNPHTISGVTLVGGNRYFFETNGNCELDTCPN